MRTCFIAWFSWQYYPLPTRLQRGALKFSPPVLRPGARRRPGAYSPAGRTWCQSCRARSGPRQACRSRLSRAASSAVAGAGPAGRCTSLPPVQCRKARSVSRGDRADHALVVHRQAFVRADPGPLGTVRMQCARPHAGQRGMGVERIGYKPHAVKTRHAGLGGDPDLAQLVLDHGSHANLRQALL